MEEIKELLENDEENGEELSKRDQKILQLVEQLATSRRKMEHHSSTDTTDSYNSQGLSRIGCILLEVVQLIKNWEIDEAATLHSIYSFLNSVFRQVRYSERVSSETRRCLSTLIAKVEDHQRILRNRCTLIISYPESEPSAARPTTLAVAQQESMREDHYVADGASYDKRGVEDDSTLGIFLEPSLSSPPKQESLNEVVDLAEKVQSKLRAFLEKIEENIDDTSSESCGSATPQSKHSFEIQETSV